MAVGADNIAFGNFQLDSSKTGAIADHFGYSVTLGPRITVVKFQSYPIAVSAIDALRSLQNCSNIPSIAVNPLGSFLLVYFCTLVLVMLPSFALLSVMLFPTQ